MNPEKVEKLTFQDLFSSKVIILKRIQRLETYCRLEVMNILFTSFQRLFADLKSSSTVSVVLAKTALPRQRIIFEFDFADSSILLLTAASSNHVSNN